MAKKKKENKEVSEPKVKELNDYAVALGMINSCDKEGCESGLCDVQEHLGKMMQKAKNREEKYCLRFASEQLIKGNYEIAEFHIKNLIELQK